MFMHCVYPFSLIAVCIFRNAYALSPEIINRRKVFSSIAGISASSSVPWLISIAPINAADEDIRVSYEYENRNRNKNKEALIRDDYWYFTNRLPPRNFNPNIIIDDPKYNAWGACSTTGSTGNSCIYVPLNQKYPAYSKYAFNIASASKEFVKLGRVLNDIEQNGADSSIELWDQAALFVNHGSSTGDTYPSQITDALLKMVLFATGFLTSPNYTGPPLELLVARFYTNEASFAVFGISSSIKNRDIKRAKAAWDFGRDSFNSYFILVNRAIVPKVGDKFDIIV